VSCLDWCWLCGHVARLPVWRLATNYAIEYDDPDTPDTAPAPPAVGTTEEKELEPTTNDSNAKSEARQLRKEQKREKQNHKSKKLICNGEVCVLCVCVYVCKV